MSKYKKCQVTLEDGTTMVGASVSSSLLLSAVAIVASANNLHCTDHAMCQGLPLPSFCTRDGHCEMCEDCEDSNAIDKACPDSCWTQPPRVTVAGCGGSEICRGRAGRSHTAPPPTGPRLVEGAELLRTVQFSLHAASRDCTTRPTDITGVSAVRTATHHVSVPRFPQRWSAPHTKVRSPTSL